MSDYLEDTIRINKIDGGITLIGEADRISSGNEPIGICDLFDKFWKYRGVTAIQQEASPTQQNMFRLYIGNIPFSFDEKDIVDIFDVGDVCITSCDLIRTKTNKHSKGYAFINVIATKEAVEDICSRYSGRIYGDRKIIVRLAYQKRFNEGEGK